MVYISNELAEKLKSYIVREGDLIISQRGTLGIPVMISKQFDGSVISANFIAIKNIKEVSPKFLQIFLSSSLGQIQLIRKTSGQVQTKITTDDVKSIKIPILPPPTQKYIVTLIDKAYSQKKQKESVAQQLIDSIGDYVLSALDIKPLELKDKTTFIVYSNDIKHKRIDAYYYQPMFEEVERAINNGKYDAKELKDTFDSDLIKGMLPTEEAKEGEVKVLQIKNILRNGLIDTSEYVTAKNTFKPEHKINNGDIIIVITGATIGKVGLWHSNEDFYLGGDMVKFSTNNKCNSYYVQAFLLSQLGQYQLLRETTGSTNKHLSPNDIKKIKIPLPSLDIQTKIAGEVKKRMDKAQQLQKEAKDLLVKANSKVERILLGECGD